MTHSKHPASLTQVLPMKDMDDTLLASAITSADPSQNVKNAISFAAYLHRSQSRANPTVNSDGVITQPTTPYIQHPLRNTLRLIRWGVTDEDVLVASLLHDVVEDCCYELVQDFLALRTQNMKKSDAQEYSFDYITQSFSPRVSSIVRAVTNPPLPYGLPREERNNAYVTHVRDAMRSPEAFLVKIADITDNAASLHLTDPAIAPRLARKYIRLTDFLPRHLGSLEKELRAMTSDEGFEAISKRVNDLRPYLQKFIDIDDNAQAQ